MASKRPPDHPPENDKPSKQPKIRDAALTASARPPSTTSRLLRLPPELRTAIYEYVLLENAEITVTNQLKPPGLFAVCCQIRTEAIGIYYTSNKFWCNIRNCNARLHVAYHKHLNRLGYRRQKVAVRVVGANWSNLVTWCHAVWAHVTPELGEFEDRDEEEAVVHGAHNIARRHRGLSWQECEDALKSFRYVVATFDKR